MKSANGGPRHKASASRSVAAAVAGSACAASSHSRSNRWRSSCPGSSRNWYPGGRVTIASAPRLRRSCETYTCTLLSAVAGGCAPQMSSISRSVATTLFACISKTPRAARAFPCASATAPWSPTTSNGPRTGNQAGPSPTLARMHRLPPPARRKATTPRWRDARASSTASRPRASVLSRSPTATSEARLVGPHRRPSARRSPG